MITDEDIERAVDYLRTSATTAAQARANRIYLEQWIKTVKAQEQQKSLGDGVGASEVKALTAGPYLAALQALKEAVEVDEKHRFLREAASAKIEAWRTMQANERAASRV